MKARVLVVAALCACPAFFGCATIVSGKTQDIGLNSTPAGATVTVEPGGEHVVTPAKLTLRRKDAPYRLTFSLDGYDPYSVTISSSTNGWLFGNLIIGGIIGIIVDSSTGAASKLEPAEVQASLVPQQAEPQASSSGTEVYVFAERGELLGVLNLE